MAPLVSSIEIARRPDDVFCYVTDPSKFVDWQANIVSGHLDGDRSPGVGTKCLTTKRIGFAERRVTSEITALTPPNHWALKGVDEPIRAIVDVRVEPLSGGVASRVTISLDFQGYGIGKLLVPLFVRREARSEMPANMRRLKERLECDGERAGLERAR